MALRVVESLVASLAQLVKLFVGCANMHQKRRQTICPVSCSRSLLRLKLNSKERSRIQTETVNLNREQKQKLRATTVECLSV